MEDRIKSIYGSVFLDDMFFEAGHAMKFTLSLDEAVDRNRMQKALEKAAEICPFMTFSAEKGEDGFLYFVKNDSLMRLMDQMPSRLGGVETDGHLSCVVCRDRDLIILCHHALTDGTGIGWFLDAILNAYYGSEKYAFTGASEADACIDLMDEGISVNKPFSLDRLVRDEFFCFPEAAEENAGSFEYMLNFDRGRFRTFMKQHNCTATVAFWALVLAAIRKAHPENTKIITGRSPVDSRKMFQVPNTFQNSSLPQIVISADPEETDMDREISAIRDEIRGQTDPDDMAWYVNGYADFIKNGNQRYLPDLMKIYKLPVLVSYMGEMIRGPATPHIEDLRFCMRLPVPFMTYMTVTESKCCVSIYQTFEDPVYWDSLAEVIEELGLSL